MNIFIEHSYASITKIIIYNLLEQKKKTTLNYYEVINKKQNAFV